MYLTSFQVKLSELGIGPYPAHQDEAGAVYVDRATLVAIRQDALAAVLAGNYRLQNVHEIGPTYTFDLYQLLPDGALLVEHWVKRGGGTRPADLKSADLVTPEPDGRYRIDAPWTRSDQDQAAEGA